jgi:peptidoglycan hydrolase CwlO-like protein
MKTTINFLLSIMFTTVVALSGCNSPAKKAEATDINLADTLHPKDTYDTDILTFRNDAGTRLAKNEESFLELKSRVAKLNKETRESYQKKIADLEQKNAELKRKLNEYKAEGKEKWEPFKSEIKQGMNELDSLKKELQSKI